MRSMKASIRTLAITGMTCGHCVAAVRRALESVPGVVVRAVELGRAEIDVADPAVTDTRLAAVLDEEGYRLDRVDHE